MGCGGDGQVEEISEDGAGVRCDSQIGGTSEWVIKSDRPSARPTRNGAKADGLDVVRAVRDVLGRTKWPMPAAREEPKKG